MHAAHGGAEAKAAAGAPHAPALRRRGLRGGGAKPLAAEEQQQQEAEAGGGPRVAPGHAAGQEEEESGSGSSAPLPLHSPAAAAALTGGGVIPTPQRRLEEGTEMGPPRPLRDGPGCVAGAFTGHLASQRPRRGVRAPASARRLLRSSAASFIPGK